MIRTLNISLLLTALSGMVLLYSTEPGTNPAGEGGIKKEDELRRLIDSDPQDVALRLELVKLLNDQERGKDAVEHARFAVEKLPLDARSRYLLAVSLRQKMGNNPMSWMVGKGEYIELLEKAIELDPGFTNSYGELIGFYLGAPAIAGGSNQKAMEIAVSLEPVDAKLATLNKAMVFKKDGKTEKALSLLVSLHEQDPKDDEATLELGLTYVETKDYSKAKKIFDVGVDIKGTHYLENLYQAGKVRILAQVELEQSVECFDAYLKGLESEKAGGGVSSGRPSMSDALWRMGEAYQALHNSPQARTCFQEALKLNPDHELARKALKKLDEEER